MEAAPDQCGPRSCVIFSHSPLGPSRPSVPKHRPSNFCCLFVLLCLFPDCDIAALTPREETARSGAARPLVNAALPHPSPSTSPLCGPATPTNCARQPLLGLPAEQDRPFSLPSSGTARIAEQRALSEHRWVPDGPCHSTPLQFGPERAPEIRHVSETQPMSLGSTHFLAGTFRARG